MLCAKRGIPWLLTALVVSTCATLAHADFDPTLTLTNGGSSFTVNLYASPSVYVALPGQTFTLEGYFSTPDSSTFVHQVSVSPPGWSDTLWGMYGPIFDPSPPAPGSIPPHLQIVTGSVLYSNPNLPVNGVYFGDTYDVLGYLGPSSFVGPTTTPVFNLRTFRVPLNAVPGIYQYVYSAGLYFPAGGFTSGFQSNAMFTLDVVPEPTSILLLASVWVIIARKLRGR
jgi:hypothetical protein